MPAGIVLTGGGISYVDGNKELAGEVFGLPVRIAKMNVPGLNKIEYITAAGMIKYVSNLRKAQAQLMKKSWAKPDGKRIRKALAAELQIFSRSCFSKKKSCNCFDNLLLREIKQ